MSAHFGLLAPDTFEAYLARMRPGVAPWLFQHVPKTAGTSLVQELRFVLPPYHNINAAAGGRDPGQRHLALGQAVDDFVANGAALGLRSVSGHLRAGHVARIRAALPSLRVFTFLRDPVARVVSEFRYTRTPKHPGHEEYLARYPTLADFARDEAQRDKMWQFLAPASLDADAAGIEQLIRRFAFIGLVEDLAPCFEFLSALEGHPKTPAARANVTRAEEAGEVELTPDLAAMIREANARDVALHDAVAARLAAVRDLMGEHVERRRALYAGRLPVG